MNARRFNHNLIYGIFKILSLIFVLNAIGVIIYGVYHLGETWLAIFELGPSNSSHPGSGLFKGIDIILIGIVMLIFGISIQSFIKKPVNDSELEYAPLHQLFDVEAFSEKKHLLWQTFLTTLLFIFLSQVFKENVEGLELLMIPICTLLLAMALFFINKSK